MPPTALKRKKKTLRYRIRELITNFGPKAARFFMKFAFKILSGGFSRNSHVRSATIIFMPPTALKRKKKPFAIASGN